MSYENVLIISAGGNNQGEVPARTLWGIADISL